MSFQCRIYPRIRTWNLLLNRLVARPEEGQILGEKSIGNRVIHSPARKFASSQKFGTFSSVAAEFNSCALSRQGFAHAEDNLSSLAISWSVDSSALAGRGFKIEIPRVIIEANRLRPASESLKSDREQFSEAKRKRLTKKSVSDPAS